MLNRVYTFISSATVLLGLALCGHDVKAQDFEFGKLTTQDSCLKLYAGNPASNAVVLDEYGVLTFRKSYPYNLVHCFHTKLKVLRADAVQYGDIKLPYYKVDSRLAEKITVFEAVVYSPGADGKFVKTLCNMSGGRTVNESAHTSVFSYALPNVKVGSIIEYKYELETFYKDDFRPWIFQKEIPKLRSAYSVHIPPKANYDVILKGGYKLSKNYVDSTVCAEHKRGCEKQFYAMDSIPAFVPENGMTDITDYIPALYFYKVNLSYNAETKKFGAKSWTDFDVEAKESPVFGEQAKQSDFFKRKLKKVIPALTDTLALTKAIYSYINHHIKWNEKLIPASENVQTAFNNAKGTSGDINLMLISALAAYGIPAKPVLISTRAHGAVDMFDPEISNFNHVVVQTHIGNKEYYLDATDPMLPFGMLPEYCFNDYSRVISETDSCYWLKMQPTHLLTQNYAVDLTFKPGGGFKGTATIIYSGYSAYQKRKFIKSFNSTDEYVEKLRELNNGIKILDATLNDVDTVSTRFIETLSVEIPKPANNAANKIYFNPYVFDKLNENPFTSENRLYPIDCGLPSEQRIVISLQLPDGYDVELTSFNNTVALPNNGGHFSSSFNQVNRTGIFSHIIKLNRSVYSPAEYPYLKELFNKIIQTQKADVILKRKS